MTILLSLLSPPVPKALPATFSIIYLVSPTVAIIDEVRQSTLLASVLIFPVAQVVSSNEDAEVAPPPADEIT